MPHDLARMESVTATRLVRLISLVVISTFLLSNYLQAGRLIPWFGVDVAKLHVDYVQGLRMIARATPFAASISLVLYLRKKRTFDLALFFILVILPLSRGTRFDTLFVVLSSLVIARIMLSRINVKFLLLTVVTLLAGSGLFALMGAIRSSHAGQYDVNYARYIAFIPNEGPLGIFALLYGYFALPFENFNILVISNLGHRTFGLASLHWLFVGFFKLNLIFPGFGSSYNAVELFQPISGASTVSTGLVPFYLDFGVGGAWVPMILYMAGWLLLYRRSRDSTLHMVLYALTSASFALSSFQPLVNSPFLFYQLLYAVVFYTVIRVTWTAKAERRRSSVMYSPSGQFTQHYRTPNGR